MVTFASTESVINASNAEECEGNAAAPATPSTVPVTETQMERKLMNVRGRGSREVDLDTFLHTAEGRALYGSWVTGDTSDQEVREAWGNEVMELFAVMRTVEEDSQALNTQKNLPAEAETVMGDPAQNLAWRV